MKHVHYAAGHFAVKKEQPIKKEEQIEQEESDDEQAKASSSTAGPSTKKESDDELRKASFSTAQPTPKITKKSESAQNRRSAFNIMKQQQGDKSAIGAMLKQVIQKTVRFYDPYTQRFESDEKRGNRNAAWHGLA